MTPKEKSDEMIKKYIPHVQGWDCYYDTPRNGDEVLKDAKQCALLAVDFAMQFIPMDVGSLNPNWKYLSEVKQEIEKR